MPSRMQAKRWRRRVQRSLPSAFSAWSCWGPTFALTILRGLKGEEGEERELTLSVLLHNPLPLLHLNYHLHPSLIPLFFACLTSLLLTSRCYWRCLQVTTRRRRDPSTDSHSKHSEKKKKKRDRDRATKELSDDPSRVPLLPPSDGVDGQASHGMTEEKREGVPPAYLDVEDEAARLMRESERRFKQRFPFDAEEAKGEKAAAVDFHTRYTTLCQEGRQRLLVREDGEDPDDSVGTEVALLQEWKFIRTLLDLIVAQQDLTPPPSDTADSGRGVWPQGSNAELWKEVARGIGEEEEAAVMRLLTSRVIAHPAWEPLCTLLCALITTSPLLLRLLLYRTIPTTLLPSLLLARPELCGLFLPVVPLLLASTSLRVQVFGVHLLAALHLPPRVAIHLQNERSHIVNLLIRRVLQTHQSLTDSIEEKTADARYPPSGVLQLIRQCVAPLLLLATRVHNKHEVTLLSLVRSAKSREAVDSGEVEDGMEEAVAMEREESGGGEGEQVEVDVNGVDGHHEEGGEWMEKRKRVKLGPVDEVEEVQLVSES